MAVNAPIAQAPHGVGFAQFALGLGGFSGSSEFAAMGLLPGIAQRRMSPCRVPEAARQIERAVRAILAETGAPKISIIAHSWGTIAIGLFAGEHPELVDHVVFFGPAARREVLSGVPPLGPWRFLTVAEQCERFAVDVPASHPPVLAAHDSPPWAETYLQSDPTSASRQPPSVKTPNGPMADIMSAWSGALAYDPARITAPVAIIRGEWDSLSTDEDAAWLRGALTSAAATRDVKIPKATHLMHLKHGRHDLHRAANDFLSER